MLKSVEEMLYEARWEAWELQLVPEEMPKFSVLLISSGPLYKWQIEILGCQQFWKQLSPLQKYYLNY